MGFAVSFRRRRRWAAGARPRPRSGRSSVPMLPAGGSIASRATGRLGFCQEGCVDRSAAWRRRGPGSQGLEGFGSLPVPDWLAPAKPDDLQPAELSLGQSRNAVRVWPRAVDDASSLPAPRLSGSPAPAELARQNGLAVRHRGDPSPAPRCMSGASVRDVTAIGHAAARVALPSGRQTPHGTRRRRSR